MSAEGGGAHQGVITCSASDDSAPQTRALSADDSEPTFIACSADESGAGGAFRSLGASSGDAGSDADLKQAAMRRERRAKRDTARALLLAILRAASAQQQQQPGATPLAQLKEE